jgi:ABC-type transport system involved in cytochrome bd biosynthesis fused ATPase/permease subunit
MQRIAKFLDEEEVPDWASTLTSSKKQSSGILGFSGSAKFQWQSDAGGTGSRFELGPLDVIFPDGKLSLVVGPTGSGKSALLSALLGGTAPVLVCITCARADALFFKKKLEMHCMTGNVHIDKTNRQVAFCGQNPCENR